MQNDTFLATPAQTENLKFNCASGNETLSSVLSRFTQKRWRVFQAGVAFGLHTPYIVSGLPFELHALAPVGGDFTKLPPFTFQTEAEEPHFAA